MAKNSVRDYSATNSSNTDIQSIDISEGCSPAGINNAIREVMADLKDVSTGAVALETPSADQLNVDNLRLDGNTISSTDTNGDITIDPDGTGDTIIASGNVGIGTSSPDAMLHLESANSPRLRLEDTTNNVKLDMFVGNTTSLIGNASNHDLTFATNDSERMRIDTSGNTLFNCTSAPSASVVGSGFIKSAYDSELFMSGSLTTGNDLLHFFNPNGKVGSIATNGSSTVYNTSSDYRLKENVSYDWDATTRLKQLKPARFNFIFDADTTVDGFLAHEAQTVVPEAITGTHNEVEVWKEGEELPDGVSVGDNKLDEDGDTIPKYQGIDQSKLVPLLVKTIQELEARITALEAE